MTRSCDMAMTLAVTWAHSSARRSRAPRRGPTRWRRPTSSPPPEKTTWGAKGFEDQVRHETATVVDKLEAAGAVLVAKLSLGALAWGDVWFGGATRNPWNPEEGSRGSSAG